MLEKGVEEEVVLEEREGNLGKKMVLEEKVGNLGEEVGWEEVEVVVGERGGILGKGTVWEEGELVSEDLECQDECMLGEGNTTVRLGSLGRLVVRGGLVARWCCPRWGWVGPLCLMEGVSPGLPLLLLLRVPVLCGAFH